MVFKYKAKRGVFQEVMQRKIETNEERLVQEHEKYYMLELQVEYHFINQCQKHLSDKDEKEINVTTYFDDAMIFYVCVSFKLIIVEK